MDDKQEVSSITSRMSEGQTRRNTFVIEDIFALWDSRATAMSVSRSEETVRMLVRAHLDLMARENERLQTQLDQATLENEVRVKALHSQMRSLTLSLEREKGKNSSMTKLLKARRSRHDEQDSHNNDHLEDIQFFMPNNSLRQGSKENESDERQSNDQWTQTLEIVETSHGDKAVQTDDHLVESNWDAPVQEEPLEDSRSSLYSLSSETTPLLRELRTRCVVAEVERERLISHVADLTRRLNESEERLTHRETRGLRDRGNSGKGAKRRNELVELLQDKLDRIKHKREQDLEMYLKLAAENKRSFIQELAFNNDDQQQQQHSNCEPPKA